MAQTNIYQIFDNILKTKRSVRLMNVFHGVPVVYEAMVREIHGSEILFNAHPFQLICIRSDRKTYIQTEDLMFKAEAINTNINMETTVLTNIIPAYEIGKRRFVRVVPQSPTGILLSSEKIINTRTPWLTSMMADISIRGVGLDINTFLIKMASINLGENIDLKFSLKDQETKEDSLIRCNGIVRHVLKIDDKKSRIGIEIDPDKQIQGVFSRFIAQRQKEILKELKEIREKEALIRF